MQNTPSPKKVRVLIVDDSSMMRRLLRDLLSGDPNIEIVGVAVDPYDAREKLIALRPDVMTLDVEMPRMDGVTFLEKVMRHFPTRTVIISSLTPEGSDLALRALSLGAVDVIEKPKLDLTKGIQEMAEQIISRVRAASSARLVSPLNNAGMKTRFPTSNRVDTSSKIIAVAASTGGTEALKVFLQGFPKGSPGMLIVQHMPPVFTRSYAEFLKNLTGFEVREAREGDHLQEGMVLFAPGDYHMELIEGGLHYTVHLHQRDMLNGVRPSADYLFKSVAKHAGGAATGVILTGMGRDGAEGLFEMKRAGAFTVAQDEETCVVFGMPKEAIALNAVDQVLPLNRIPEAVLNYNAGRKLNVA